MDILFFYGFHALFRIHAEENKRRTLQRSDIAAAITKTDMFDFLIDIVPREEFKIAKESKSAAAAAAAAAAHGGTSSTPGGGAVEHRRSQESFPSMGAPSGPGLNTGMEGYGYAYGILENGSFAMVTLSLYFHSSVLCFVVMCIV